MLDLMTARLWVHPYYPDMKAGWVRILDMTRSKEEKLRNLFHELVADKELIVIQTDIFHVIELFMDNRSGILPSLAAEMYPSIEEA